MILRWLKQFYENLFCGNPVCYPLELPQIEFRWHSLSRLKLQAQSIQFQTPVVDKMLDEVKRIDSRDFEPNKINSLLDWTNAGLEKQAWLIEHGFWEDYILKQFGDSSIRPDYRRNKQEPFCLIPQSRFSQNWYSRPKSPAQSTNRCFSELHRGADQVIWLIQI